MMLHGRPRARRSTSTRPGGKHELRESPSNSTETRETGLASVAAPYETRKPSPLSGMSLQAHAVHLSARETLSLRCGGQRSSPSVDPIHEPLTIPERMRGLSARARATDVAGRDRVFEVALPPMTVAIRRQAQGRGRGTPIDNTEKTVREIQGRGASDDAAPGGLRGRGTA